MNISELALSRQKVLIGAGVGLVAAVLAACSTNGKKPEASAEPSPTTAAPSASSGSAGPAATSIAKTTDIPVASGVIVGDVVVTQPSAGVFKAFSAKCTHAGCMVNKIADGTIDCPCHGSKFDLDGTVAHGPAQQPLDSQSVTVQGDSIVLG
ncbi:MAG: Rieske (2Fe-2S) protein [Mycobacterium sp.]